MLKWENKELNECVVCSKKMVYAGHYVCQKCNNVCEVNMEYVLKKSEKYCTVDAKSKCCNADFSNFAKSTCSEECHEKMVKEMEKDFGEFKKVIDQETMIAYKVPTRDIIEQGLSQEELKIKYPRWT